jgi:hypothetical protein
MSLAAGEPIPVYAPKSHGAEDLARMAGEVIHRSVSKKNGLQRSSSSRCDRPL